MAIATDITPTPTVTDAPATSGNRSVRTIGIISVVVGLVLGLAGIFTYNLVGSQLAAQNIVVAGDAPRFAGEPVTGPFTAYAEAQIIDAHAKKSTNGLTYAEMDREDPARATAMNASFLQASLYTSVIAFGVAALVSGLGIMFLMIGAGFIGLAKVRR